jgi:hypothetical protein
LLIDTLIVLMASAHRDVLAIGIRSPRRQRHIVLTLI